MVNTIVLKDEKRVKPEDRIISAMLHVYVSEKDGFEAEKMRSFSWRKPKKGGTMDYDRDLRMSSTRKAGLA